LSYILEIQTAVPEFKHAQETIMNFYQNSTDDENTKRKIKIVSAKAKISYRYSVLPDFSVTPEEHVFFPKNRFLEPDPDINVRMGLYKKYACGLAAKAINKIANFEEIKSSITHIITVTCTGLSAPGLDIELIREFNLRTNIERSSINFMGCNAAILALKSADYICKSQSNAKVLVVCTELSTLHFQKNYSDDYILSTSLFGDGCAAMIVASELDKDSKKVPVKVKAFHSVLLHSGHKDMAWHISDKGFVINLSSYVSQIINSNIKDMMASIGIDNSQISHWAIHPGGKKILNDFRTALNLSIENLIHSYDVLNNFGNMSSPTVLFVLKQIIDSNNIAGEKIFTAAFGPGLSIETMLLEYV